LQNSKLYEQKEGVKLIIDTTKLHQVQNLKFDEQAKGLMKRGDGKYEIEISGIVNVRKLKQTVNAVFKRHFDPEAEKAT
jgi:hypothetical protein